MLVTTPKIADKASKIFHENKVPIHYAVNAIGTASNEMMDILGLGSPDRSILISALPKNFADDMLSMLQAKLKFRIPGNGIAFTVAVNGANNHILKMLEHIEGDKNAPERKDDRAMTDIKRVMIAAVVNHGYSEEVMNAARDAGASGGTVVHGRGVGDESAMNFWGLGVQEEKEVILIVADAQSKLAIMQAIGEKCGMHSEAKGMVVSLPIDEVVGLDNDM